MLICTNFDRVTITYLISVASFKTFIPKKVLLNSFQKYKRILN